MAFENTYIKLVERVALANRLADDGALTDMTGCFTDGETEVSCEELTAGSEGLRIQFSIPVAWVSALTVKFWDDGAMDEGSLSLIPYSDVNTVDDTNEIESVMVVNADTDFVTDASFRGDLGDADGNGNFAVRIVAANGSSPKPKASEVEYEMTIATQALNGVTYDNDGVILVSCEVKAYFVTSTGPEVLAPTPFDTTISHGTTGAYTLNLPVGNWKLLFNKVDGTQVMDISEDITLS